MGRAPVGGRVASGSAPVDAEGLEEFVYFEACPPRDRPKLPCGAIRRPWLFFRELEAAGPEAAGVPPAEEPI